MDSTGQAIRAARGCRSQQVFATRLGIGMLLLRKWEQGRSVPDRLHHIEALEREGVDGELLRAAARAQVAAPAPGPARAATA